ncbi:MAG: tRNA (guanosine(46)-N7)-methyltransferase TrmB [Synergistaceae bacterium]|jgi:tRNA (guanine-N7-)-methyltransferase|nr:tRNA (guanosine(46)-N7)-methyltransferase TrmB [Synergistaceae bacterium]
MAAVDYGSILFPGELPLDPARLSGIFSKLPRTELEIGFGNGEFTVQHAAANPDTLLIGMEVSPACVVRCARRAGGLPNLKIICTDARFMMKELFVDASLDRVWMNFPCPWPKRRHAHRRVTAGGFADDLAAVLKVGGVFELATDEEWYACEARDVLGGHEALSVAGWRVDSGRSAATKYERKWLSMGKSTLRLSVVKTKSFTVRRRTWDLSREWGLNQDPNNEGCEGVHVKTGRALSGESLAEAFGAPGVRGDARWVFKRLFRSALPNMSETWLIETISTDGEFEQRFHLKVAARDGGTLIKLDGTARVFLTPAVRFALEDLARRLSGQAVRDEGSA